MLVKLSDTYETIELGDKDLRGYSVKDKDGVDIGKVHDLLIDLHENKVRFLVVQAGGFLGMGQKLFAVPWNALKLDTQNKRFVLDMDKDRLKSAPGFDSDHWPNMADPTWAKGIHSYYGTQPYSDGHTAQL